MISLNHLILLVGTLAFTQANLRGSYALNTPCSGPNNTCGPMGICGFADIYNNAKTCDLA
jgi:hypothetical protein